MIRRAVTALLLAAVPAAARAQGIAVQQGASVIGLTTAAWPMPFERTLVEARLVEPVAMADASWRTLSLTGMMDLEALTMDHGQLGPGAWGESFLDRRHPHTFLHELVASWTGDLAEGVRASVSAGKGFAPFGSDDPMSRPAVLYPINHHWSQVPERVVAIAGLAIPLGAVEVGVFNGDEPDGPWSWPKLSRFGDSWSTRVLLWPALPWEIQLSYASVASPEQRDPATGPRNTKWSASARWNRETDDGHSYALVELARTTENGSYNSLLVETEHASGRTRSYARAEITERPEPVRLATNPFRYASPDSLAGASRWYVFTAGWARSARWRSLRIEPVIEGSLAYVAGARGPFDPVAVYGSNNLWSISLGVRVGMGMRQHRMGRYGVLRVPPEMDEEMPGMQM